jgi:hypothetical protein
MKYAVEMRAATVICQSHFTADSQSVCLGVEPTL